MHWWAELWDNWAKTFGYDHWEWGSASDAFAAIGTVGALAITLYLLRKDRRDKTEELARGVVGWYDSEEHSIIDRGVPKQWTTVRVDVHNSSPRPVTVIRAYYMLDEHIGMPMREGSGLKKYETLLPNESGFFEAVSPTLDPANLKSVIVTFYDANGLHWTRNLTTQEIERNGRPKWRRRYEYWSWMIKTGVGRWVKEKG